MEATTAIETTIETTMSIDDHEVEAWARRHVRRRQSGFTLLEIMIVIAIIAMIAGGVGVALFRNFNKAKISAAKLRVKAARDSVTQYMIETPSCPHSIDELVAGKFLDKGNAKDPWGSPLIMRCPGTNDTDGADIVSPGPDKQEGTPDDVKSWDL